jgi:hypothetical protein
VAAAPGPALGGEFFAHRYAAPWAWAAYTPFPWTKQVASHLGRMRDLRILPVGHDSCRRRNLRLVT